jgi:hypothetical protein
VLVFVGGERVCVRRSARFHYPLPSASNNNTSENSTSSDRICLCLCTLVGLGEGLELLVRRRVARVLVRVALAGGLCLLFHVVVLGVGFG